MRQMILRFLAVPTVLVAMATIALGADNTIGTWKYNPAKSKVAPGVPAITNMTATRESTPGGVKITMKGERVDGSKIDNVTDAKYDGKPVSVAGPGLRWDTAAIKQINADTFTEERSKQGGKFHSTVRTVVSKDGKIMTSTTKGSDENGKAFTAVAVFDKQ
jgi:hypothetical protein